jgi:hypothetical protein
MGFVLLRAASAAVILLPLIAQGRHAPPESE